MKSSFTHIHYVFLFLFITSGCQVINKNSLSKQNTKKNTYNLDPNLAPSENFHLTNFKLRLPSDTDKDGKPDMVSAEELNKSYQSEYFYTGKNGGMVFKCPSIGATTSNSKYARVELREMLRNGDKSIKTKGVTKNNWVFGSVPYKDKQAAGAVDGEMEATLAINRVTTSGEKKHIGRIIIGQIHSNTDEPIRLYYRKLKKNLLGSIYFAHEINNGKDTYYEMIGGKSNHLKNPIDGIALNEKFSYNIKVVGNLMYVTISRPGKENVEKMIDMKESGYDKSGVYQYFKAGIYNNNNTADKDDYAQVTFYNLEISH